MWQKGRTAIKWMWCSKPFVFGKFNTNNWNYSFVTNTDLFICRLRVIASLVCKSKWNTDWFVSFIYTAFRIHMMFWRILIFTSCAQCFRKKYVEKKPSLTILFSYFFLWFGKKTHDYHYNCLGLILALKHWWNQHSENAIRLVNAFITFYH